MVIVNILFLRINFITNLFILNKNPIQSSKKYLQKIMNKKNEVRSFSYCSSYLVHIVVGCKRHARINLQIKMDYHRFRSFHHPSPSASNLNIDRLELLQLTTVPFVSFWTPSAATLLHFSLFNIPLSFTGNVQTIGRKQTGSNRSEKFRVSPRKIWY